MIDYGRSKAKEVEEAQRAITFRDTFWEGVRADVVKSMLDRLADDSLTTEELWSLRGEAKFLNRMDMMIQRRIRMGEAALQSE